MFGIIDTSICCICNTHCVQESFYRRRIMRKGLAIVTMILGLVIAAAGLATAITSIVNVKGSDFED